MAESGDDELCLISKGLYRIVSDVIGPECIVKLRRMKWEVSDLLDNCDTSEQEHRITSGSRSEGFAFKSSDTDMMYVDKNTLVCTASNISFLQNIKLSSLFHMDNEECSPGFTLLRCLTCDRNNVNIFRSLVRKGDNMYLSSKSIRETFMSTRNTEVHGPCQSETYIGIESDDAYTMRYPFWPNQARSFFIRSIERGWPSYDVLKDICNDGCLFIPINSKQQTCSELMDLEWRMSFSLAEKKLIYSMNHCQFLCYGLMKLLNEVIKELCPIKDLMCSYFMKTAVFWEMSDNSENWSIQTFLSKFWNVFRRLMKWVNDGYCPNFFIPENNMFYGKICGENQRILLSVLSDLYAEGYMCLLRCPSLNKNLTSIIRQPYIANMLSYNEEEYVSMSRIEGEMLLIVLEFDIYVPTEDMTRIIKTLHNTVNINTESEIMRSAVRLCVNDILQKYEEVLLISTSHSNRNFGYNRKQYVRRVAAKGILLRANTYFCMNYLHYAKSLYMAGNYHKTISMLHFIKRRLQSQPYMYRWSLDGDIIMATRQQGMSYDTLIKSSIVSEVMMDSDTTIDELQLECHAKGELTGSGLLFIPPLVFMNFLLILCYTGIEDYHRRHHILEELHTLLYHDNGHHIRLVHKAIAWEILGICQQICGDYQAAFQSYIKALNEEYNYFKAATTVRISSLYDS
ncbi:hypothetical protein FSP39_015440 [Pinctada imbricata]|uniref:Mab-21-like HhH/H2TH-like domain-containing protein n=1 Tax=Pinctada imbricata TaxID=66713 RepID=A0AA88XJ02_PINIB|nr:hypothetical protein FSP39_015440 [Pinctada imbricata]